MSTEQPNETVASTAEACSNTSRTRLSLGQVILLWAIVTAPMVVLAWVVAPWAIARAPFPAAVTYWLCLWVGMIWQTAVALWAIRRQEGNLNWTTLKQRLRLNAPKDPRTGRPTAHPWWRLVIDWPILALIFLLTILAPLWILLIARFSFDVYAWPGSHWPAYANLTELASPEFAGQFGSIILGLLVWFWSAILAEETFFRGVLLAGTAETWGRRRAWLANAALYAAYYAFQWWLIPARAITGLIIARTAQRYRSTLPAIVLRGAEGAVVLGLLWLGYSARPLTALPLATSLPYVSRRPTPLNWATRTITVLPDFDPQSGDPFQVDLRTADVSSLDLGAEGERLSYADFDTRTAWPTADRLPEDFDPAAILELGKDPGLGVRSLHERGITGRGVGVAIIDQQLLTEHIEYADRLRWYEENPDALIGADTAQMHAPAVASLAVGHTNGVAPEADLYFFGTGNSLSSLVTWSHEYAEAVRRIVQINTQLPAERRIHVISLSTGAGDADWIAGYDDYQRAVREAEAAGIMVVTVDGGTGLAEGVGLQGLGRDPGADPNDFASAEPGIFWADDFYAGRTPKTLLMAPMDSRTVAAPNGAQEYAFSRVNGSSWVAPYFAGLYALAAQVDPAITPKRFWSLALSTGRTATLNSAGEPVRFGLIVDPVALIAAIEK